MCSGLKDFFFNTDAAIITVIISSSTLLLAMVGGGCSLYQWNNSNKIKRAEFLLQMVEKLHFDNMMCSAKYLIDYQDDWYSADFHKSNTEREIDRLFIYLSSILYLKEQKLIGKTEFNCASYTFERVCSSVSAQQYFWNIYHFSKIQGTSSSFQNLIKYALKKKFIPKECDFKNPKSEYFIKSKYLEF